MGDEFLLKLSPVEKHRSNRYDDHLLVNFVELGQGFEDPWNDVVSLDLFLCLFMYAQVGNGCDDISKNLFLSLVIQKLKENL